MDQQDADGDGLLSSEEFAIDSDCDKFARIEEDGDGIAVTGRTTDRCSDQDGEDEGQVQSGWQRPGQSF